jgi:hypothetical protein
MSDNSRRYELECARLAADCMQLVDEVHNRSLNAHFLASNVYNLELEIHFLRIARVWTARAQDGQDRNCDPELN